MMKTPGSQLPSSAQSLHIFACAVISGEACMRPPVFPTWRPMCHVSNAHVPALTWYNWSCCPADAIESGPELTMRRARQLLRFNSGPGLSSVYSTATGCLVFPQVHVAAPPDFLLYLLWLMQLNGDDFLESFSTSPLHESPSFVQGTAHCSRPHALPFTGPGQKHRDTTRKQ